MLRCIVIVLLVAGCGRVSFEQIVGDGSGDDKARLVTTTGTGDATLDDIALTDAGDLVIVGGFTGTLELGGRVAASAASINDLFVAALDGEDRAQWLWNGGCSTICNAQGVEWLGSGAVAGGYFAGTLAGGGGMTSGSGQDALIAWFGADGGVAEAAQFGGSRNVQIRGLALGGSTIAITGTYADTVDFGDGALASAGLNDNGFIATFDATTHAVRSSRAWSGAGDVYGNDIAVAPDGSTCVVGRFMVTTDFGGGPISPADSNDAFVVRYDAQGNFAWARRSGAQGSEAGSYATALDNGDCVIAGYYQGAFAWDGRPLAFDGVQDSFVARFAAADGAITWLHTFTGPGSENVFALASWGDDRIALGVVFDATARLIDRDVTSDADADASVIVLDGAGTPLSFQQVGGTGSFEGGGGGAAFDPSGTHVGVGMTFTGDVDVHGLGLFATSLAKGGAVLVVPVP